MAFTELETKRIEKAVDAFMRKRRPPPHIRSKLDFGYRITGHSLELFEVRPVWNNPKEIRHHPFAKATYVKTTNMWRVFWQRADLKWHGYPPAPYVETVTEFLQIVDQDAHSCFFG